MSVAFVLNEITSKSAVNSPIAKLVILVCMYLTIVQASEFTLLLALIKKVKSSNLQCKFPCTSVLATSSGSKAYPKRKRLKRRQMCRTMGPT